MKTRNNISKLHICVARANEAWDNVLTRVSVRHQFLKELKRKKHLSEVKEDNVRENH